MDRSRQGALMIWCVAVILFGLILMGAAFDFTDGSTRTLFAILSGTVPEMNASLRFATGLMGAVSFGWGLTLLAAASVTHALPDEPARLLWRRIGWAVIAWFLTDSAISVATGFALNAVPNALLLLTFLVIVRPFAGATGKAL